MDSSGEVFHTLQNLAIAKVSRLLFNGLRVHEMLAWDNGGKDSCDDQMQLSIIFNVLALDLLDELKKMLLTHLYQICSKMVKIKRQMVAVHEEVWKTLRHNCYCIELFKNIYYLRIPDCVLNDRNILKEFMQDDRLDVMCRFFLACNTHSPDDVLDIWKELSDTMHKRLVRGHIPVNVRGWSEAVEKYLGFIHRLPEHHKGVTFVSFIQNDQTFETLHRFMNQSY